MLYPCDSHGHVVVQTMALAQQRALQIEGPLVDIESTSPRMRTATVIMRIDRHVPNNHRTVPTLVMSTYE